MKSSIVIAGKRRKVDMEFIGKAWAVIDKKSLQVLDIILYEKPSFVAKCDKVIKVIYSLERIK